MPINYDYHLAKIITWTKKAYVVFKFLLISIPNACNLTDVWPLLHEYMAIIKILEVSEIQGNWMLSLQMNPTSYAYVCSNLVHCITQDV